MIYADDGNQKKRAKKRNTRDTKRANRRQPPIINPCPSGPSSGCYSVLSDSEINQIFTTALRILCEIGMGDAPPSLVEQALHRGATISESGRLCFPPGLMEDIIDNACKQFVFYGRDTHFDFEIGGDKVFFGTGGAAIQTMDLNSHLYRPSTLQDLYDFTRLADTLNNVSWFTRCCVATDVPDSFDLDINTAYAMLCGTNKPIGTSFMHAEHVDPAIELFDTVLGGEGKFRDRPFCKAHISPVISPLRYAVDAVDVALACMQHGMPINSVVAAQAGATSPATIAGMLACSLAETLAALAMVNLFEPGYPMIFSNWPFVVDLRTGSFSGAGGEITLLNAASAQISNWLGLPSGAACSMSDAKAVDAQMGLEKSLSALAVGLAGCNMVYESSGMSASLLGASFEAFLIDDEMLSHVYRILRGIEVNEETLGFEAIRDVINGDGHFLGSKHTINAMERDYFYPSELSSRTPPVIWQEQGASDMWQRANHKAREILKQHNPVYLDSSVDKKIRHQFNILLNH